MTKPLSCAKAPCKSCPYRRDVPSGVWAKHEYDKLPAYDGSIASQAYKQAGGLFMCHQQDGKLCAGWVGAHGPANLLALRLAAFYDPLDATLDPGVWDYKSPVPLFGSGAEAAAHGKRAIRRPGKRAKQVATQIHRKQQRTK